MTDTTHEAPERIWAGNWLADLGQGSWDIGEWRNCDWPSEGYKTVEYVRTDLVQAAVAAALREAAGKTALMPTSIPANPRLAYHAALDAVEQHILALIPEGAQAALDRMVAAERERCAKTLAFLEFLDENYRHAFGDTARAKIRELHAELKVQDVDRKR